jgi:ribonuclease HII
VVKLEEYLLKGRKIQMEKRKIKDLEKYLLDLSIDNAIEYLNTIKDQVDIKLDKLFEKYSKKKLAWIKEQNRLKYMYKFESEAYEKGYKFIAGVDEVGRGPLAGPVVTAAVILKENELIEGVDDSKKLSEKQREILYEVIKQRALAIEIGIIYEKEIDEINILNATKKAMEIAILNLSPKPDFILLDAVKLEKIKIDQCSIIKGDSLSISIAAASIIAKVTRDRLIVELDKKYPEYGFAKHKGYGTAEHIAALRKYGICPIHRVSFTKNFV